MITQSKSIRQVKLWVEEPGGHPEPPVDDHLIPMVLHNLVIALAKWGASMNSQLLATGRMYSKKVF